MQLPVLYIRVTPARDLRVKCRYNLGGHVLGKQKRVAQIDTADIFVPPHRHINNRHEELP